MNHSSTAFSHRPIFWIILSSIFVIGSALSFKYFARVFPVINIDITMNRIEALNKAHQLAVHHNWGPRNYQQAALFDDDNETQNYIELEGGGKKVFAQVLAEKYFSPYTWQVRHFKEGDVNETLVEFTPEGKLYGFRETLSENAPGAALTSQKAQEIAEKQAQSIWNTDFLLYTLVERSQETKPSGRIDHTFSYENNYKKVGQAPYRLKLVVSGDTLTEYDLSIKVPESFKRHYEHMRSFNSTITKAATIVFIILYIFGGCFIGLFFLMRRHWLVWKLPLFWAGLISLLDFLNNINSLPFYWMNYNTQLTKLVFLINTFLSMILSFIGYFGIFTLIFIAAESLGRKAFPQHLQFWKLWSRNAACSWQVLGRTLGGYLILGFDFAFVIAFYYIAFRYFGWWTPSETLINPNVLSYYIPWLASISQALQAGFVEECLFRAIPLSCAVLIGKKYNNKTIWLIIGMIMQAIIFSAAHASYPAQPGYARLVELIIPSMVFGAMYLFYGLLPSIISHFIYDVVWMALPLFISTAPGIWIDKMLVILASALPLFVVFNARFLTGKWKEISTQFYNYNWQPTVPSEKKKVIMEAPYVVNLSKNKIYILTCVGLFGLALWIFGTRFEQDARAIKATKKEAIYSAMQALHQKNIDLNHEWTAAPLIESQLQDTDRFVWQIGGKNLYHQLRSSYIKTPQWKIRFAKFEEPDIIEGAEEYALYLNPISNAVNRLDHQLPESRSGKILSEQEARELANKTLKKEFNLDPKTVIEISAVSTKQPDRLDWLFTFKDPQYFSDKKKPSGQGQARINIEIAGDEVVDYNQYIFIPEEWTKEDQQNQAILKILTLLCTLFLFLFLAFGATRALIQWIHHEFDKQTFFIFFSILIGKSLAQLLNIWVALTATFKTTEPYWNQAFAVLGTLFLQIIFKASAYGLLAGFIARARFRHYTSISLSRRIPLGLSIGTLLAGIDALCSKFSPSLKPLWADYTHANTFLPSLSCALTTFTTFLTNTMLFYLIIWTIDYFNTGTKKALFFNSLLFILTGLAMQGATGVEHTFSWFISGTITGLMLQIVYSYILKYSRSLIPLISGTFVILQALQQMLFNAYSGAFIGNIVSCIVIAFFVIWWSIKLEHEN